MIGRRFGKLTVVDAGEAYVSPGGKRSPRWICLCDCGGKTNTVQYRLKSGHTQTCGRCVTLEKQFSKTDSKMLGVRFERLVVIARSKEPYVMPRTGQKDHKWDCLCDCGKITSVRQTYLKNGITRSCGCLRHETIIKHKMSNTPTYETWRNMKNRCGNKSLKNYGANGVTVCDRWLNSFDNFLADMGERPSKRHSLDRKDGTKGYEPGNCRWATRVQQNRNTSRNRYITVAGKKMCVSEAAALAGMPGHRLLWRLNHGWPVERAMGVAA